MVQTNENRERLTEEDLYRISNYGVGILGLRPVVSLPASKAHSLTTFVQRLEIFGIFLFMISATLFVFDSIGNRLSFISGAAVIVLRAFVILVGQIVIARTVYTPKTTNDPPDLEPTGGTIKTFDDVTMNPTLDGNELAIKFTNRSLYDVSLKVAVTTENGVIRISEPIKEFTVPTQHNFVQGGTPAKIRHTSRFDLSVTNAASEYSTEEIMIEVSGTRINTDEGRKERIANIEAKFSVKIQNNDEIISDEYEYEVLNQ